VAERYADGRATAAELSDAASMSHSVAAEGWHDPPPNRPGHSVRAAYSCCFNDPVLAAWQAAEAAAEAMSGTAVDADSGRCQERHTQAALIRDIIGNPFRPVAPDLSWVPQNAAVLAQTMYDSRDFTLMPLLADLLEEAGCPAEVSDHCRGDG